MTLSELYKGLEDALEIQISAFAKELEEQGHKATGKLIKSLKGEVERQLTSPITAAVMAEKYGVYVDKGVRAENVKYSPYILLPWAKKIKPSLSDKELKSFVFAVWQKHKKEGIPTARSYKYSKNGNRKKWIQRGVDAAKIKVDEEVSKTLEIFAEKLVTASFENL